VTLTTPRFENFLVGRVRTIRGNKRVKFEVPIALTVLELLAFNAQKIKGPRDPGYAPFSGVIWTLSFNRFLNWSDLPVRCARAHTTHTHRTKTVCPPFTPFTWRR